MVFFCFLVDQRRTVRSSKPAAGICSRCGGCASVADMETATRVCYLLTVHRRARERDEANRQTAQVEATLLLATRTEQRVNALENRVGSFEQRVEKRLDQIADDVGDFKKMFSHFLINHLKP